MLPIIALRNTTKHCKNDSSITAHHSIHRSDQDQQQSYRGALYVFGEGKNRLVL
jgi:hypothetical protein